MSSNDIISSEEIASRVKNLKALLTALIHSIVRMKCINLAGIRYKLTKLLCLSMPNRRDLNKS